MKVEDTRHAGEPVGSMGTARTLLPAIVCSVVFGVLIGSIAAARGQSVFGAAIFQPLNRMMAVAVFVGVAILHARRSLTSPGRFVLPAVGTACAVLHTLAVIRAQAGAQGSELFALGLASCVAEGVLIAIAEMTVLDVLCGYGLRVASVAIAAAFVLNNVYDLVFVDASEAACLIQWLVASVPVVAMLWWLAGRGYSMSPQGDAAVPGPGVSGPGTGLPLSLDEREGLADTVARGAAGPMAPYAAFITYGLALLLFQGFFSCVTGLGGIGESSHFGASTDIVMLVVRCLLVSWCVVTAGHVGSIPVVCVTMGLWIVSSSTLLLLWGSDSVIMADWVRQASFYAMQVMLLVVSLGIAVDVPQRRLGILAAGLAAFNANQVTRFVTYLALGDTAAPSVRMVVFAVMCSLAVLAVLGTVAIATEVRRKSYLEATGSLVVPALEEEALVDDEQDVSIDVDPLLDYERRFCESFERICDRSGVTPGEKQALFLTVHGYTIEGTAARLGLSRETVKTELARAYMRTGAGSKQGLLAMIDGDLEGVAIPR